MDSKEFRVLMKHCFFMKKNAADAKKWLDKCYPDSAPGEATIRKWFAKFRTGHMSTEDDERSGRPKEAVTDENIKKIHKMILEDRKVKLIVIADTLKISKERVGLITREYLGMRKLCAKWVPRELTVDQKQQRVHCVSASVAVCFKWSSPLFVYYLAQNPFLALSLSLILVSRNPIILYKHVTVNWQLVSWVRHPLPSSLTLASFGPNHVLRLLLLKGLIEANDENMNRVID